MSLRYSFQLSIMLVSAQPNITTTDESNDIITSALAALQVSVVLVDVPSQAKVGYFALPAGGQQHVSRRQISMHQLQAENS